MHINFCDKILNYKYNEQLILDKLKEIGRSDIKFSYEIY